MENVWPWRGLGGDGLRTIWAAVRDARAVDGDAGRPKVKARTALRAVGLAVRMGALGRRPAKPA